MLKVENIDVYYDKIHAIKNLSFHVNQGEVVTLIGANGAGKTTILKTLSKILEPTHGVILFEGEPLNKLTRSSHNFPGTTRTVRRPPPCRERGR